MRRSRSRFARLQALVLALAFAPGSSFGTAHDPGCQAHAGDYAEEHSAVDLHAGHSGSGHHAGHSDGQSEDCSCESGLCGLSAVPHAYLPATSGVRVELGVEASSSTVRFASLEVVPGERTQPPAIGPPRSI